MYISRSFKIRFILASIFILFLSTSAYAFASANTVIKSGGGDGSAAISGYTIANVHYTLDGTDPSTVTSIAFSLAPAAGGPVATTVKANLVAPSGSWFNCTQSAGTWTCTVSGGVNLADADELRVVAVQ